MAGLIYASERSRRHAARTAAEEEAHSLDRHWRSVMRSLQGGVGVWGDPAGFKTLHWKLDKFEDPSRRSSFSTFVRAFEITAISQSGAS